MVQHLEGAATGPGGELATCLLVNGRLRSRHEAGMDEPPFRGQILGDRLLETAECHRWQPVLWLKHLRVELAHVPLPRLPEPLAKLLE